MLTSARMRGRGFSGAPMQDRTSPGADPIVAEAVTPTYKKPSTGQMIAGTIGDALQEWSGGHATFAPMMAARMKAAEDFAVDQRTRSADYADWERKQRWQRDNPAPANNDTANDYAFIASKLGQPAADQWLKNMGDPTVTVQLPGDRVYSGPRSGLAGAMGAGSVPTAPVGRLTPMGGAGAAAPVPFRR